MMAHEAKTPLRISLATALCAFFALIALVVAPSFALADSPSRSANHGYTAAVAASTDSTSLGLAEETSDFEAFMKSFEQLEMYASQYALVNDGDKDTLLLNYLRAARYNDWKWSIIAGAPDEAFSDYVDQCDAKNGTNAAATISATYKDRAIAAPDGSPVDLIHLFAIMDGIRAGGSVKSNQGDLCGFAGDLTELLSNVSALEGDTEQLVSIVSEERLNHKGGFDAEDVNSDLDGVNLMSLHLQRSESTFTKLMRDYYTEDLNLSKRARSFRANRFGSAATIDSLRTSVYDAYCENALITVLEGTYNVAGDSYANQRKACCYAFADLLDCDQLVVKQAKKRALASSTAKTVIKAKNAFKVVRNESGGAVTYEKIAGNKKIRIAKSGKVIVRKGLRAGRVYTCTVRATSRATANYAAASCDFKFKVKVADAS